MNSVKKVQGFVVCYKHNDGWGVEQATINETEEGLYWPTKDKYVAPERFITGFDEALEEARVLCVSHFTMTADDAMQGDHIHVIRHLNSTWEYMGEYPVQKNIKGSFLEDEDVGIYEPRVYYEVESSAGILTNKAEDCFLTREAARKECINRNK